MQKVIINISLFVLLFGFIGSAGCNKHKRNKHIHTGADQVEQYIHSLKNKKVAVVANQTSLIGKSHLVDTLISLGITVKKIFGPEHGFRGTKDAGEIFNNNIDLKTGMPVISLHGKHKKPQFEDLQDIDVIVFDIQDVGVRFYTYISTLQYVMEACAEQNIELLILDRPNPNGFYVDGPVLDTSYRSFLGLNPIPLVHGMTIGEMALMINGEGLLKNGIICNLKIIPCKNYNHNSKYILPVKPSPNLPTMASVYLYPSLGLFTGTHISMGRGTKHPFEIYGHPKLRNTDYSFIPVSIPGASKYPKFENEECYGFHLGNKAALKILEEKQINLEWLISSYNDLNEQGIEFFNPYFPHHAGSEKLKEQIINGISIDEIRKSWEDDISKFKAIRKKYLLYKDFE
ncbi:exo-beta-N-acetylmuramidase NamZ domain-containing protein [Bacteroidota bacterium]